MGNWKSAEINFDELIHKERENDNDLRLYPFYLAYPVEGDISELVDPTAWYAEWKWDGIRSQIIFRSNELYIWTRGEELATGKFPELHILKNLLPDGTVLDGEIVSFGDGKPLPFNMLQTRISRKNLMKKILQDAPVAFIAYDILEINGVDIRPLPHSREEKSWSSYLIQCWQHLWLIFLHYLYLPIGRIWKYFTHNPRRMLQKAS